MTRRPTYPAGAQELEAYAPDILALQEVDEERLPTFWRPWAERHGYGVAPPLMRRLPWVRGYGGGAARKRQEGLLLLYRVASFEPSPVASAAAAFTSCLSVEEQLSGESD